MNSFTDRVHNLEDYVWLKVVHVEWILCRTIRLVSREQNNCKHVCLRARVCVCSFRFSFFGRMIFVRL